MLLHTVHAALKNCGEASTRRQTHHRATADAVTPAHITTHEGTSDASPQWRKRPACDTIAYQELLYVLRHETRRQGTLRQRHEEPVRSADSYVLEVPLARVRYWRTDASAVETEGKNLTVISS